jgi:hypothetical protein
MVVREGPRAKVLASIDISTQARAVSMTAPAVHQATYLYRVSKYLGEKQEDDRDMNPEGDREDCQ